MASHSPREATGLSALVSVHDVMPETRPKVERLLQRLNTIPPPAVALLVVPGRNWTHADLSWLHSLSQCGYPLIAHGWHHECSPPRTLTHRLHSQLLSNRAAEHLSLSTTGITQLMRDCHVWFQEVGLTAANVYIPPAWALGPVTRDSLKATPFRYVETLRGLYDTHTGRWYHLPVTGFEVDRWWRAALMRMVNHVTAWWAVRRRKPLRIAIHPQDWQYPLANQLDALLDRVERHDTYPELTSTLLSHSPEEVV
ncbi:polysaccharide deacetylase family protein [Halomonadaceae bacterium KBTZ08]